MSTSSHSQQWRRHTAPCPSPPLEDLHNNFTEKTVHACPNSHSRHSRNKKTDGKLGVSPHPVEASARSFKQNIQHVKKSQRIGGAPFPARLLFFATPTRTQHHRLSNSSTSFLTPKSQRCQISNTSSKRQEHTAVPLSHPLSALCVVKKRREGTLSLSQLVTIARRTHPLVEYCRTSFRRRTRTVRKPMRGILAEMYRRAHV